ncbi:MAG: exodeoxyribonuclease III [Anaerolineae bacterium]|nr:exodeoxyribonuclease III [Anaerolineae bacterium]
MGSDVLRVATLNANSIRVRLDQILAWMDEHAPDVLCIQETKVQDEEFPRELIEGAGYQVAFRGQKSHAGVAMIAPEELAEAAYGLDGEDEPRLIRAMVRGVPVVNTYVPQGRSTDSEHFQYKLEWFARLKTLFERDYAPGEPLIWVGDLNVAPEEIDIHDPEANKNHVDFHPEARAALADVMAWGFVDVVRQLHPDEAELYSYWDYRTRNAVERGIGWRVDHIMATEPMARRAVKAWIDVEARKVERPSDHTFVVADFDLS